MRDDLIELCWKKEKPSLTLYCDQASVLNFTWSFQIKSDETKAIKNKRFFIEKSGFAFYEK